MKSLIMCKKAHTHTSSPLTPTSATGLLILFDLTGKLETKRGNWMGGEEVMEWTRGEIGGERYVGWKIIKSR